MIVMNFETTSGETEYYRINQDVRVILWTAYSYDLKTCGLDIDSWWDFLLTLDNNTIYFHNLNFDGNFILKSLRHGIYLGKNKWKMNNKVYKIKFFIFEYQIYSIDIWFRQPKTNKQIHLCIKDSNLLLNDDLASLSKILNISDLNYENRVDEFTNFEPFNDISEVPFFFIDECYKDCMIIFLSLIEFYKMLNRYPMVSKHFLTVRKMSSNIKKYYVWQSSKAVFLWKKKDKYDFEQLWLYTYDQDDYDLGRKFFKGGYNFLPSKNKDKFIKCNGVAYDFNSAYSYIMQESYLPLSCSYEEAKEYWDDVSEIEFYEVQIKSATLVDLSIPFHFLHNWELGYGYTTFLNETTVYYTKEEWDFLNNYYDFDIINIKIHKKVAVKFMKQFCKEFYKNKKNAENMIEYHFFKSVLNTSFGDFSQRYDYDLYFESDAEYEDGEIVELSKGRYKILNSKEGLTGLHGYTAKEIDAKYKFKNIWVASYITSIMRLYLYKYMLVDINNVLYCDTDSFYLKNDNEIFHGLLSSKIGGLKIEAKYDEIFLLGPKRYLCFQNGDLIKHGLSGVPKRWVQKEVFEAKQFINNRSFYGNIRRDLPNGLVYVMTSKSKFMV